MGHTVPISASPRSSCTTGRLRVMDAPAGLSSNLILFLKIGDGPDLGSRLRFALDHRFLSFKTKIFFFFLKTTALTIPQMSS